MPIDLRERIHSRKGQLSQIFFLPFVSIGDYYEMKEFASDTIPQGQGLRTSKQGATKNISLVNKTRKNVRRVSMVIYSERKEFTSKEKILFH